MPKEKKPKRIVGSGASSSRILTRFAPRSRLTQQVLRTTLGAPGVRTCLQLTIRSQ